MILYTMMPHELIFPTDSCEFNKQQLIEVNGVSLIVNEVSPSQFEIVRVVSSNPQHFLDDKYTPGQKISISDGVIR